jgi:hypothetical protein
MQIYAHRVLKRFKTATKLLMSKAITCGQYYQKIDEAIFEKEFNLNASHTSTPSHKASETEAVNYNTQQIGQQQMERVSKPVKQTIDDRLKY